MSDEQLPPEEDQPLTSLLPDGFLIDAPSISDGCGWIPMEFVAAVKCLTPDGTTGVVYTITPGLTQWEAIGMTTLLMDSIHHPETIGTWGGDD
jgi:hypothetical protein